MLNLPADGARTISIVSPLYGQLVSGDDGSQGRRLSESLADPICDLGDLATARLLAGS